MVARISTATAMAATTAGRANVATTATTIKVLRRCA
jgi:hypothetical protein